VEASGEDSSESSNIFPPKGSSWEFASASMAGTECDSACSAGEAEMVATSAGAVEGVGAGGAMCDSGDSQPGILDCSEETGAAVGGGVGAGADSVLRESGASQSGTFTSSTCSMS
jgi:hypothetical protein